MSRVLPEYYPSSDGFPYKTDSPPKRYPQIIPRKKVEYGDNYDLSQLDEPPMSREPITYYSPRRKILHMYDDDYRERLPMISVRQTDHDPSRHPQLTERIRHKRSLSQIDEDHHEVNYRVHNDSHVPHTTRDRTSRQKNIDESNLTGRQKTHAAQPISSSISPGRPAHGDNGTHTSSSRLLRLRTHITPLNLSQLSTSRSKTKEQQGFKSMRTPHELLTRSSNRNTSVRRNFDLKDVLAQNRARRGSRIPQPRCEIEEEEVHDLPIGNRDFIKDDLLVYK